MAKQILTTNILEGDLSDWLNQMGVKCFFEYAIHNLVDSWSAFIYLEDVVEIYFLFLDRLVPLRQGIGRVFLEFLVEFLDNLSLREIHVFRIIIKLGGLSSTGSDLFQLKDELIKTLMRSHVLIISSEDDDWILCYYVLESFVIEIL